VLVPRGGYGIAAVLHGRMFQRGSRQRLSVDGIAPYRSDP
jgi:hypothetical protein